MAQNATFPQVRGPILYRTHRSFSYLLSSFLTLQHRTIERSRGETLAKDLSLPYFEASAQSGQGVDELFNTLVNLILNGTLRVYHFLSCVSCILRRVQRSLIYSHERDLSNSNVFQNKLIQVIMANILRIKLVATRRAVVLLYDVLNIKVV